MSSLFSWQDPALPVNLECSAATMEKIRRLAFDGLMSLPRVGLGVGGFLLGTRAGSRIRVTGLHPIECSHANGPSFDPTAAEIEAARGALGAKISEVAGYYCSRPRRAMEFTAKDAALFLELCPLPGQVFLLVRPSATEATQAAFFYPRPGGIALGGAEHPLEPWQGGVEEAEAEPEQTPAVASAPISDPGPATEIVSAPLQLPPPPAGATRLFGEPAPVAAPAFTSESERRAVPWKALGAVAATVALLIGGWASRDQWLPRPPLELHTAELNGHFSLEWNRAAVRGVSSGTMRVIDGAVTRTIVLDRKQLDAGTLPFARQSPDVAAELVAGDSRASARFVAQPKAIPPNLPEMTPEVKPTMPAQTMPAHPQ